MKKNENLIINKFGEKCGVAAVWDKSGEAPFLVKRALIALQHRGQESAGITVFKRSTGLVTYKQMGLIRDVLTDTIIKRLGKSKSAIAQNRYSTTGKSSVVNCQPFVSKYRQFTISIGHNGNIPDLTYLTANVKKKPKATSDTALLAALLVQNRPQFSSWSETLTNTLPSIKGAYCLVIMTEDSSLYAARDPYGIRPLVLGKTEHGWVIASETVALDTVNAHFVRDVQRGEIIHINKHGELTSAFFGEPKIQKFCIFEHVYFSRPDSYINGKRIKVGREALGKMLAKRIKEKGIQPDVIVPIFNSGYYAAKGVASELGLPFVEAVITNAYFGRTFIKPSQDSRVKAVNGKHNFVPDDIYGKKVLFVDDSAVRSTTSKALTYGLLHAGAKEVYAGFSSPPIINTCDLGIDMKSKDELAAAQWEGQPLHVIEKNMAQLIGANDVVYIPLQDTIKAIGGQICEYYSYYFGGLHPIRSKQDPLPLHNRKIHDKPKLAVFISGSGTNLQKIIDEIESGRLHAEISHVVSNKPDAYGLTRAKKYGIPVTVVPSKGIYRDHVKRKAFDRQLSQLIETIQPDVIVMAGWMVILGDVFLNQAMKMQIPVINLHPALLSQKNDTVVHTSRGIYPVLRGIHAIAEAYENKLSLSGVTVHQVLPGNMCDTGPIIMREEVRSKENESIEEWETRIHEAEYRALPTALKRLLHVMRQGIDVSKGEFIW